MPPCKIAPFVDFHRQKSAQNGILGSAADANPPSVLNVKSNKYNGLHEFIGGGCRWLAALQ
jgi:hypothetical protein